MEHKVDQIPNNVFTVQLHQNDEIQCRAIFPEEVWKLLLDKVQDFTALKSCSHSSPYLRDLLLPRSTIFLFPNVLPYIAPILKRAYEMEAFFAAGGSIDYNLEDRFSNDCFFNYNFPGDNYLDDNIPDDNIPDDNIPEDNIPDDNNPDDNNPDDNIPDDNIIEDNIPDDNNPDDNNPDDNIPDDYMPDDNIPDDDMPNDNIPDDDMPDDNVYDEIDINNEGNLLTLDDDLFLTDPPILWAYLKQVRLVCSSWKNAVEMYRHQRRFNWEIPAVQDSIQLPSLAYQVMTIYPKHLIPKPNT